MKQRNLATSSFATKQPATPNHHRILAAATFAVLLALFCLPVAKAQRISDVSVTSTIKDFVDYTDPNLGTTQRIPMQIESDGLGPYRNTKYVQSIIQSGGDWELDALSSRYSDRKVYLDFSQPITGSGSNGGIPVAPFTSAVLKARFISKCHDYGNSMFTILGGQTVPCPLVVTFDYAGNSYRLPMNPLTNYPETDYVNITCTGVDANSQCNQWKIEPSGACVTSDCTVRKNVVRLGKLVTVKGQTTEENQGDFYMSFSISITNP